MAHDLSMFKDEAGMAYVGAKPWHKLGQQVRPDASLEEWRTAAHLDWHIARSPAVYEVPDGGEFVNGYFVPKTKLKQKNDCHILWRSDTGDSLSHVSNRYKIVQPSTIVATYRSLVEDQGYQMETLGSLDGGRKIWALARTNRSAEILPGDNVDSYLLLATSCDFSLPTTGMFTSVRVVCNNTLTAALNQGEKNVFKVRHNTEFDFHKMRAELNIGKDVFEPQIEQMRALTKESMSANAADDFLSKLLSTAASHGDVAQTKGYKTIMELFTHAAIGSDIKGVSGTRWAMLNAVTEYVDHKSRARSDEKRFSNAQFGEGAKLKDQAFAMLTDA